MHVAHRLREGHEARHDHHQLKLREIFNYKIFDNKKILASLAKKRTEIVGRDSDDEPTRAIRERH